MQVIDPYLDDFELDPEFDDFDLIAQEDLTFVPTCDHGAGAVEANNGAISYSTRSPRDVILSGPVVGGWGPGRYHRSRRVAFAALKEKYGEARVVPTRQVKGRWSFLVKNLRAA